MEDRFLKILSNEVKNGGCILIMGPEAHLLGNYPEESLPNHRELIIENSKDLKKLEYDAIDGFFYKSKDVNEWYDAQEIIFDALHDYYSKLEVPDFYKKLAALPFNTIISLSPDDLFPKALQSLKIEYDFAFLKKETEGIYFKKSDEFTRLDDIEKNPSIENPIVFNFLGHYDHKDSMVFTYDALFRFMQHVFQKEKLPKKLLNSIRAAQSFLLVGFGYRQWFLKILFFVIERICEDKTIHKKAIFKYGDDQNNIINQYDQQFNIRFYKEKDTIELVNELWISLQDNLRKPDLKNKKLKIMLMASQPDDDALPLRPDKDWQIIKETLNKGEYYGKYELLEPCFCTQSANIFKELKQANPDILLLSMHGERDGLFFEKEDREKALITPDQFLDIIKELEKNPDFSLKTILFCACDSDYFAQTMSERIEDTIGFNDAVYEEAVQIFVKEYLRIYFLDYDAKNAFDAGKLALNLNDAYKEESSKLEYYNRSNRISQRIHSPRTTETFARQMPSASI
jgi:hypothetical protein